MIQQVKNNPVTASTTGGWAIVTGIVNTLHITDPVAVGALYALPITFGILWRFLKENGGLVGVVGRILHGSGSG